MRKHARDIDHMANLADFDFEVFFRVLMLRLMVKHRGISTKALSKELNLSPDYVTRILNGTMVKRTRNYHALLDRLDDAITRITDAREAMCTCSDAALLELRLTLKEGV